MPTTIHRATGNDGNFPDHRDWQVNLTERAAAMFSASTTRATGSSGRPAIDGHDVSVVVEADKVAAHLDGKGDLSSEELDATG